MDKNFTTIFTRLKNVDLIKVQGLTALNISRITNNEVKCKIVTLNNDDYFYYGSKNEHFDLIILDREKRYKSPYYPVFGYLRKNSKNIDILNLYHLDNESLLYAYIYKFYNGKGKILLELDADDRIREFFEPADRAGLLRFTNKIRPLKKIILNGLVKKSDFIAVETGKIYKYLTDTDKKLLKKKLFLNPYGINVEELKKYENPDIRKENKILTIGRIGTFQKNNEMMLEAIKRSGNLRGWKFYFIGPIEKGFEDYIEKYFTENPLLEDSVKFLGDISDRRVLSEHIQSAKIFCLTSRYESWGIVLTEAAFYNCFIISTDVGCAREITENMAEGRIIENVDDLSALLETAVNGGLDLNNVVKSKKDEYLKKASWENTVSELLKKII